MEIAKAQMDRDEAMSELFVTMSDALSLLQRFDLVAMHADDKKNIQSVAININECADFIYDYARITGFGTISTRRCFLTQKLT